MSDFEKFTKLLNETSINFKKFIVENETKDFPTLRNKLAELNKAKASADKIAIICAADRNATEAKEEFIDNMVEQIVAVGIFEKMMIQVLSHNI